MFPWASIADVLADFAPDPVLVAAAAARRVVRQAKHVVAQPFLECARWLSSVLVMVQQVSWMSW